MTSNRYGFRGDRMKDSQGYIKFDDYAALAAENEVLRNKLEWLRQAEHLVIWDGERWKVRPEHGGKAL